MMSRLKTSRFLVGLLIVALVGPLAPNPTTAHETGVTHEEYEDVVERLERARRLAEEAHRKEHALQGDISETAARRRTLEIELEELGALVGSAESRLAETEAVLGRIQAELDRKNTELEAALDELQRTHDLVQERAVQVYKNGPVSFAEFLIGADDLRALVTRFTFVVRIFARDEEQITSLSEQKERIKQERAEIQELRDEAKEQVGVVRAERDRVASIRNAVDSRWDTLTAELRDQYSDLSDARSQKETYLRQQKELEAESQRIAALLRGRNGGEASVGAGGMAWPTSGPVTSGYGWRTHPIFGTRRFHSGIDIGAPSGRSVVASASGTVIHAGPKGGYGNTVIVDHGGGLATLYAHLSVIGAGTGSSVNQGQFLGRVGCTGYCTGPHLHFEVRVNGDTQNPMRWLS